MRGVSIVIKCFNEEHKIDAAIASALAAGQELAPIPVEVVVADSRSTDATAARAVQWARNLSVRVVQLLDPEQRGCGVGVELGFMCSVGERVLLMDGDMVVQPGFIRHAMRYLDQHPRCAGVAGLVSEASLRNGTDRIRVIKGRSPSSSTGGPRRVVGPAAHSARCVGRAVPRCRRRVDRAPRHEDPGRRRTSEMNSGHRR